MEGRSDPFFKTVHVSDSGLQERMTQACKRADHSW